MQCFFVQHPAGIDLDAQRTVPFFACHGSHGGVTEDHSHVNDTFDRYAGTDFVERGGHGWTVYGVGFDDLEGDGGGVDDGVSLLGFGGVDA